jgi:hypothetical protein
MEFLPRRPSRLAHWWEASSTDVPFSGDRSSFNLLSEQFWGRAARASRDSQEFRGARYFCASFALSGGGTVPWTTRPKRVDFR